MDALQIIAAIFLFLLALYWLGTYNFAVIKSFNIPGPTPWPFVGNIPDIWRYGSAGKMLDEYRKRYGKVFYYCIGQETSIFVADPQLVKLITVKEFDKFRNRYNPIRLPHPNKYGIGQAEDHDWKRIRSTLTPTFSASKMKQMVPIIEDSCDVLMNKFRQAAESGAVVNINEFSQQYILEVLMSSAFGLEVNTQTEPQKELADNVNKIFRSRLIIKLILQSLPFYTFMRRFLGVVQKAATPLQYLNEIAYQIINQRKQQGIDVNSRKDFVHLMLTTKDKDGNRMLTDDEISAQSVTFLTAGLHTSSFSMRISLFYLAKNPDMQEKLHREIVETIEENPDMSMYDLVQKMEYLECFFNEMLRYTLRGDGSGALSRVCTESCTLNGVHFPKGTPVILGYFQIHHDEDYWREPSKFDPERFRGPEKEQRDPNLFTPFGVGPRNCIGMRFAQMEIRITLARLVKEFRFKIAPGSKLSSIDYILVSETVELLIEQRRK